MMPDQWIIMLSEKCKMAKKDGIIGNVLLAIGIIIGIMPLIFLLMIYVAPTLGSLLLFIYIVYAFWWVFVLVGVILVSIGIWLKVREARACL